MFRTRSHVAAAVAVLALVAAGAPASAAPAPVPDADGTAVTVDLEHPFGALPRDFVGLSYEERELSMGSFDVRAGNLVHLFNTLGPSNIRIGGNTLDRDSLWVPAGQEPPNPLPEWVQNVIRPDDITRLGKFLRRTGWKAEVGVNVGRWDAARATDQIRTMFTTLGDSLTAVACGNEPNAWLNNKYRTPPYGYPEYKKDWETCADVVGNNRIAGPDTSSPTSGMPKIDQFAADEKNRLTLLATHNYPVGGTSTAADLLSRETADRQLTRVSGAVTAARAAGLPLRLDETNSAVGGGSKGVSDAYASSLWAFDYSMAMAQAGVSGLDFHGGLGVCGAPLYNGKFQHYTPICPLTEADKAERIYSAAPEYYGLFMAARMGPGRFLPVTLTSDRNVSAYAVRGDDGKTRIAVIQKDDVSAAPVNVSLNLGASSRVAHVVHLTGTSLNSRDGIAIEGETVDRDGRLARRAGARNDVHRGVLNLDLAAGSAVLITLGDCYYAC